jgi:hypothetical protein
MRWDNGVSNALKTQSFLPKFHHGGWVRVKKKKKPWNSALFWMVDLDGLQIGN